MHCTPLMEIKRDHGNVFFFSDPILDKGSSGWSTSSRAPPPCPVAGIRPFSRFFLTVPFLSNVTHVAERLLTSSLFPCAYLRGLPAFPPRCDAKRVPRVLSTFFHSFPSFLSIVVAWDVFLPPSHLLYPLLARTLRRPQRRFAVRLSRLLLAPTVFRGQPFPG